MSSPSTQPFTVNGRTYRPPGQPVAVICLDGCADDYLGAAIAHGRMPHLSAMARDGYRGMVRGALPSFTNVNNTSIVTGVPPAIHGICGNFFLDPATGLEVMMNDPAFRRCPTLLNAAADAGRRVAFITAKEKLRTILGDGLVERGGIAFSSEKVLDARPSTHGIGDVTSIVGLPAPGIYSAAASLYVLHAGASLVEQGLADFLYLSTTDFMQHKFRPEAPEMLDFHAEVDRALGRLLAAGCRVALTADHGMNAKNSAGGAPNVIYLESLLHQRFGPLARVICPITDPYVVHHGALGSLVMVHLESSADPDSVSAFIRAQPGITEVYRRDEAASLLELAPDRIGDLVVLSGRHTVIGKSPEHHDLSVLDGYLRSHGGRYEEMVPLVLSHPPSAEVRRWLEADPRNFDVFPIVCAPLRS